jgi:hypothetical protein
MIDLLSSGQGTSDFQGLFPRQRYAIVRQNYRAGEVAKTTEVVSGPEKAFRIDVTEIVPEPKKPIIRDFTEHKRHVFLGLLDVRTRLAITRLWELLNNDEDEVKPSNYAFSIVWNLLLSAARRLSGGLPNCVVYTDDEGGIRCEWKQAPRQVRLVIPARSHGRHYIYHEEGDHYSVEETVSPETLAIWLRWLIRHEPAGA